MKTLKQFLTVVILAFPAKSTAQIWKNLGKKVEEKIERQASTRLERKIDKTIDKGFDKVEETADNAVKSDGDKKETASKTPTAQKKAAPVTLADAYHFKIGISYRIQNEKQKPMEMTMWLGAPAAVGMSVSMQEDVFMVMQEEQMISFMKKQKKYMVMGSGLTKQILKAAAEEAENEPAQKDFTITKIGTERILNYSCDIYEVKSADYSGKLWLTQELGMETGDFMSAFSAFTRTGGNFPAYQNTVGGMLLKMIGTHDSGTMQMEATAIHADGLKFSTAGYTNLGL